jgi:hypothetical protein
MANTAKEAKETIEAKTDRFWDMDLEEFEATLLRDQKVTDLPVMEYDSRVPPRGSVLLNDVINIDKEIQKPNIFLRLWWHLRHLGE